MHKIINETCNELEITTPASPESGLPLNLNFRHENLMLSDCKIKIQKENTLPHRLADLSAWGELKIKLKGLWDFSHSPLIGILIFSISIFSCSGNKKLELIQECIYEVKTEFAPDKRTALFEIKVEKNGAWMLKGETNLPLAKAALIKKIEQSGIHVMDDIIVLPKDNVHKKYAIINVSVANLRADPSHSAELATQALLGTPVNVLKNMAGWYLVQTPDNYIAWTNGGSLEFMDETELNSWKANPKIIYLNTSGYSMNEAGSQRVSDLVAGNILTLHDKDKHHWSVTYPDERKAIVNKNEALELQSWKDQIALTDSSITREAKELMGVPYLWGGTSTKGVDCSGFTKTVYFLHGMIIPRDASQQVLIGKLIDTEKDFNKLHVGDLLFFGRINEDRSERATHVGMWLGNNQFIHSSGDVHISSMDSLAENFDDYNYKRYLRTKRIIGAYSEGIHNINDLY